MDLEELQKQNKALQDKLAEAEASLSAVVKKKEEILDEKKKLQQKIDSDYVSKEKMDETVRNSDNDKIKNLEKRVEQLTEGYNQVKKDAEQRAQKLKEQSINSAIISEFGDVCHNPKEFAAILKYQGLAVTNDKGEPCILDEGKEITVKEFREKAVGNDKLAHHFKPVGSRGTGYSHSSSTTGTGANPFSKTHWNITKQMELMKKNPQLAARLKKEANQ